MKNNIKSILVTVNWIACEQFGIDIRKLLKSFFLIPGFLYQYLKFKKIYDGPIFLRPCFHDAKDESSGSLGEYFYQDLFVSQRIYQVSPTKHVDIGSRVDGLVAQIASYRPLEVLDVRPLKISIKNITFKQVDLVSSCFIEFCELNGKTDSLSCLHTLEHIGLGRYGDKLQRDGLEVGIENLSRMLETNGTLYLSVPVGKERVYFNANKVLAVEKVINIAMLNHLSLEEFYRVDGQGINKIKPLVKNHFPDCDYLGLFVFRKIK
jgi:hypothetical protein